ncbi:MAG: hypothetical protein HYX74_07405 [Acidobacteria bacterium]|nr:hypothetical protein [Acidobacteriota bacterium]
MVAIAWTFFMWGAPALAAWNPPEKVSKEEITNTSNAVLAMPDIKLKAWEEIFRIPVLGMDWDIGAMVYEPEDPAKIPSGPDQKKVGIFLLHGGAGDYRSMDRVARLAAGKFGFKVVSMTYPGNLYLLDSSRNWPGDTINPDGTVRTPIWNKDKPITPDQVEIREDKSMLERYGTHILACGKEGTEFYNRLAAYPVAFEEAAKDLMRRHFPDGEYSIYIHGHSTGGPFSFMLTQRVANIAGVVGMENSPFGYIYSRQVGQTWNRPFNCLVVRTWRDTARYAGPEALAKEGPEALKHLPMLMERVFEDWKKGTSRANLKAEYPIHLNGVETLVAAARAAAKRLNLNAAQTEEMVERYKSYPHELTGPGVKPVPPVILGIAKASPDHSEGAYKQVVLPAFAAMKPAPKVRLVQFDAGTHGYSNPEPGLPMGVAPAVVKLWHEAIMAGYYLHNSGGLAATR